MFHAFRKFCVHYFGEKCSSNIFGDQNYRRIEIIFSSALIEAQGQSSVRITLG